MIKTASVVYLPGIGGNFIRYLLSLSPETVPYYTKSLNDCDREELDTVLNMTVQDRAEIVAFKTIQDYEKFHSIPEGLLYKPENEYKDDRINNAYKWAIQTDHPKIFTTDMLNDDTIVNTRFTKHWNENVINYNIDKIVYLDLDSDKYLNWLENSYTYFTGKGLRFGYFLKPYQPERLVMQKMKVEMIKNLKVTDIVSMTAILDSTDGFVNEYTTICNKMEITPLIDSALQYYQEWRQLRVDPFL